MKVVTIIPKVTSKDVISALYRHLTPRGSGRRRWPGPPGAFCVEIRAPRVTIVGPRGGRRLSPVTRADVVYVAKLGTSVTVRGPLLVVYEVKVSKADLKSELAKPEKSEGWKKYADQFILVVGDAKILEGLEIPEDWGIQVYESGRIRTLKRAPRLKPIDQAIAWNRVISFMAWRQYQLEASGATASMEDEAA